MQPSAARPGRSEAVDTDVAWVILFVVLAAILYWNRDYMHDRSRAEWDEFYAKREAKRQGKE